MIKLDECGDCNGTGDDGSRHGSSTCYRCGGRGWLWMGKRHNGNTLPDSICQNLIEPADLIHARGLLKNVQTFLTERKKNQKIVEEAEMRMNMIKREIAAAEQVLGKMANGEWRV